MDTPERRSEMDLLASALSAGITRKELLQRASALGIGLSAAGLLAACGSSGSTGSSSSGGASGNPVRGGLLAVGIPSGGQAESYNPNRITSPSDSLRCQQIFDPFIRPGTSEKPLEPGLVLEWLPNGDGTVWELKLRPDVTWQNGKDFTADDVIFTIRSWNTPTSSKKTTADAIYLDRLKKLDPLTVQVPLKEPQARLYENFLGITTFMTQDGQTDFTKPIGTGPFSLESFQPGQQSVVKANPNYWDEGKPYLDSMRLVSISDDSARLNALTSGTVDMITSFPFTSGKQYENSDTVVLVKALADYYSFYMAVDKPPFQDERVRQAMRLIADRQALVNGALAGFGEVRNDLTGFDLPFYASSLPQREQDIEQAKSLLKQAGAEDLSVTLRTSVVLPGYTEAAQLYAQQAKQAGVDVKLEQVDPAAYFNPSLGYGTWPFGQSSWPNGPSLSNFYRNALLSASLFNETHWKDPQTDAQFNAAQATQNEEETTKLWFDIQKKQYDSGGYIFWAQSQNLGATSPNVGGVKAEGWQSVGDGRVWEWWKS